MTALVDMIIWVIMALAFWAVVSIALRQEQNQQTKEQEHDNTKH